MQGADCIVGSLTTTLPGRPTGQQAGIALGLCDAYCIIATICSPRLLTLDEQTKPEKTPTAGLQARPTSLPNQKLCPCDVQTCIVI